MQENIRKRNLLIISDSPVQRSGKQMLAYEPVVRELEAIADGFDTIVWLASKVSADHFALCASKLGKLKIVSMPSVQNKVANALLVFFSYPVFLFYIIKYLPQATHVHTRGPSHPALLGVLMSFVDRRRAYWHKYAGNWIANDAPFMYRLQKLLLKKAAYENIKVTVNGKWENEPNQINAFENPCISESEISHAYKIAEKKDFTQSLKLLFVGNLSVGKGVLELVEAVNRSSFPNRFSDVYIAGNGPLYQIVKDKRETISWINIHLLGQLSRNELNDLYSACHVIILPSLSEGFPKVIAEGAAYGCIPVVTDVSSLSQYIISGENGYLMRNNSADEIVRILRELTKQQGLKQLSMNATNVSGRFTFEYFRRRIENEIFIK